MPGMLAIGIVAAGEGEPGDLNGHVRHVTKEVAAAYPVERFGVEPGRGPLEAGRVDDLLQNIPRMAAAGRDPLVVLVLAEEVIDGPVVADDPESRAFASEDFRVLCP